MQNINAYNQCLLSTNPIQENNSNDITNTEEKKLSIYFLRVGMALIGAIVVIDGVTALTF